MRKGEFMMRRKKERNEKKRENQEYTSTLVTEICCYIKLHPFPMLGSVPSCVAIRGFFGESESEIAMRTYSQLNI